VSFCTRLYVLGSCILVGVCLQLLFCVGFNHLAVVVLQMSNEKNIVFQNDLNKQLITDLNRSRRVFQKRILL